MPDDAQLREIARRLTLVDGVLGVTLGGSRARGTHRPESDTDLGLYYRPTLDVARLGDLARELAGPDARVTAPGEWGPWVDGGAWLTIDGRPVDWIYRDLDRVHTSWSDAQDGRVQFHTQTGHPLGVAGFTYAAEVALCVILADPTAELSSLQSATRAYPEPLRHGLVEALWEARFAIDVARKATSRGDTAFVAGCVFRAVGLCAHALHGHAGRWLTTEKGAVAAAQQLPDAPRDLTVRVNRVLGAIGGTTAELDATLDAATELVDAVRSACRR